MSTAKKGKPNPVDVHVGSKLRERRTFLGMSQEKLARAIGLKFQQVQKYEGGVNRIGASRLFDISNALSVPVSYFFDGLTGGRAKIPGFADEEQMPLGEDPMTKKETLQLVRAYYSIPDPKLRKRLLEMAKAMAETA